MTEKINTSPLPCDSDAYDDGVYITDMMPLVIKTLEALATNGVMTQGQIREVNPFAFEWGGFATQMQDWHHIAPAGYDTWSITVGGLQYLERLKKERGWKGDITDLIRKPLKLRLA